MELFFKAAGALLRGMLCKQSHSNKIHGRFCSERCTGYLVLWVEFLSVGHRGLLAKGCVVRALSCRRGPSTPWVMRAGFNRLQVRSRQAGRSFEVEANWDPSPSLTSSQNRHIRFQLTLSLFSQSLIFRFLLFFSINLWIRSEETGHDIVLQYLQYSVFHHNWITLPNYPMMGRAVQGTASC